LKYKVVRTETADAQIRKIILYVAEEKSKSIIRGREAKV